MQRFRLLSIGNLELKRQYLVTLQNQFFVYVYPTKIIIKKNKRKCCLSLYSMKQCPLLWTFTTVKAIKTRIPNRAVAGGTLLGTVDDEDGSLQRSPSQHVTSQLFSCSIGIPCKAVCTYWQVCVLSVLHIDITEQLRT